MKINKKNYQAFILDYYEGNLSAKQAAMLMSFLEKHPELKKDFEDFEIIELENDKDIKYSGREFLKKPEPEIQLPVTPQNVELFCIAEFEGLLSDTELAALNSFISKNPSYESVRKKYSLAYISPDEAVVFENKYQLKKLPSLKVASLSVDDSNYEEYFSAYIDGELSESGKRAVELYIKDNPGRRKELSQWKELRLSPDPAITFPLKSSLKRHQIGGIRKIWYSVSAAAVVLIIAGLFFMNDFMPDQQLHYAETIQKEDKIFQKPDDIIITADVGETEIPLIHRDEQLEKIPVKALEIKPERHVDITDQAKEKFIPEPININRLASLEPSQIPVKQKSAHVLFDSPMEFYAGSYAKTGEQYHYEEPVTLPRLAMSELEKRTGFDFSSDHRSASLRDLAGTGLAAISQITGSNLNVERERDENGRLNYLAIGDNFSISRSTSQIKD